MRFRLQRRLNIKRGLGLNVSKSGGSLSVRTKAGSVGAKGFSIRTGIPGISYRKGWGKTSGVGPLIGLILSLFALVSALISLIVPVMKFLFWLFIMVPANLIVWFATTLFDLAVYLIQRRKAEATETHNAR